MALGSNRRKSKAVIELVRWFYETHASDVPVVGIALTILTAMRAVSRASVCNLFQRAFVEPYGDAIKRHDEAAFLSSPVPTAMPASMSGLTVGVHRAWDRMGEDGKSDAWRRLDALMEIA